MKDINKIKRPYTIDKQADEFNRQVIVFLQYQDKQIKTLQQTVTNLTKALKGKR